MEIEDQDHIDSDIDEVFMDALEDIHEATIKLN